MLIEILKLESKLFLRSGKYGRPVTILLILFLNGLFGSMFLLGGYGVARGIDMGILPLRFIDVLMLLIFNASFFISIPFGVMEAVAIFTRPTDAYLLTSLPIEERDIALGKTLWIYLSMLVYIILPLICLYIPLYKFIGMLGLASISISILFSVALGSALATILGFMLLKIFNPIKMREKLMIASFIIFTVLFVAYQLYFPRIVDNPKTLLYIVNVKNPVWYLSPGSWGYIFTVKTIAGDLTGIIALSALIGLTGMAYLVSFKYAESTYYLTITELNTVSTVIGGFKRLSYPFFFIKRFIGEKAYFIFLNEARLTRRETYRLINIISLLFVLIIPVMGGTSQEENATVFLISMVVPLTAMVMGGIASQSFGLEGESFQLMKAAPISGIEIAVGKTIFYLLPALTLNIVFILLYDFYYSTATNMMYQLVSSILGVSGSIMLAIWIGVKFPNFKGVTTGIFGSRRQGVTGFGSLVYMAIISILYFFPTMILTPLVLKNIVSSSKLQLIALAPSILIFIIGLIAFKAAIKDVEEIEVL